LLLRQCPEEVNLLLVGRLPFIVDLESALKMLLYLHIEGLRLYVYIGWIVNSWDCLGRNQVM